MSRIAKSMQNIVDIYTYNYIIYITMKILVYAEKLIYNDWQPFFQASNQPPVVIIRLHYRQS